MKNDKKQNKTEKGKPFYCEPVISREGKIGRLTVDDPALGGKSKGKKALVRQEKKDGAVVPSRVGRMEEVTISDSEFFRSSVKKTKNKRGVHTIKSKDRNPFPVVTVLACVVCTILFMSLVFNLVRINEYTKDISDMRGEVSDLTREKSELTAVLEKKNNSEDLANYLAKSEKLSGMVKEDTMNPAQAVTPEKIEKIEDFRAEEESDAVITTVLNALARNFSDVLSLFGGE